ncbi:hypothetical protein PV10_05564 [Exophiala mesophila]|uniref:DUF676 domain-containing protein n=1 Tax=Exophiala mesophila TaxID=212818 RepID=A0A0D1XS83_EXOME|nr:uncharacterized protein PV10_05564 [Exophiala mesophila]KIV90966.1 hypothetical protein PV10_05564 [Exophiala mesophila]
MAKHRGIDDSDSGTTSAYNSGDDGQAPVDDTAEAPTKAPAEASWVPVFRGPEFRFRDRMEIVAIHGIAGKDTWTHSADPPLAALLEPFVSRPTGPDHKTVHVYTTNFEYDPVEFFQAPGGASNLDNLALALLNKIAQETFWRDTNDGVPMVLLAHDIGGIIAQRAVLIARHLSKYQPTAFDMERMVLFSTPVNSADDEGFRRLLINLISTTPNRDIRAGAFGTLEEIAKACKATADELCKIAPSLSILTVWEMGPPENDDNYNPVTMIGADTPIGAIVYGSVDISTSTRLPEHLHQINLEDYAVNEGRPHRKILIDRALNVITKKEPRLAKFRHEVEEQIPDFENKSMEETCSLDSNASKQAILEALPAQFVGRLLNVLVALQR